MDAERIKGAADTAKGTDPELPPDSEMQKTVDQAQETSGGATTTLREAGAMKDAGKLYPTAKP
jgi:hypothetical protein